MILNATGSAGGRLKLTFERHYTTGGRRPDTKLITNKIKNTTNSTFAIQAAVPATAPMLNAPAMIAMTKNTNAQCNMASSTQF